ncbi:MAG TPA: SH3 domain-containing protein [Xanthobacteraceae bacterium]|nr:SH3 domain-containing protein [Xanthobacteraceae bacterium]
MTAIKTLSATLAILAVSGGVAAAQSPVTNLNMRSGPGTGYQVLGVIPAGAPVAVLGCDGRWCQVNYAGRIGYANGNYLGGDTRTVIVAPGVAAAAAAYASSGGYGYGPTFGYGYRRGYWGGYGGYAGYDGYAGYGGGYGAYAADYGPGLTIGIGSSWDPAWRGGHN